MADSEPVPPVEPADGLQRTTTVAIVVRLVRSGWQVLGAALATVVFAGFEQRYFAMLFGGLLLFALVGGAFAWLSWSRFRYGVVDRHLVIHEGILVKRRRSIPVARVQGIDIKADLLMRLLGLVEVTVQTAGGGAGEPEASIIGIPLGEAERLRSALLHDRAVAAATPAPTAASIGQDPVNRMSDVRGMLAGDEVDFERPSFEYRLSIPRLFLAGATSSQVFLTFFVVVGAGGQIYSMAGARAHHRDGVLALALPVLVLAGVVTVGAVIAGSVTAGVIADFGFTSRRVGNRIETERGLIERRMVGLPVNRVQSVRVQSTPLRRLMGFSAIHVDTAGFGRSEANGHATAALVPLARSSEVRPLLHGLLPELELAPDVVALPRRAMRRYLFLPLTAAIALSVPAAAVLQGGWLALPLVAIALAGIPAVLAWRGAGIGVAESMLVLRAGILGRTHTRIPRSRLQSLTVSQNPFQKHAGLATITATTVSGSSGTKHRIRHVDAAAAWRLVSWFGRGTRSAVTPASHDPNPTGPE